MSPDKWEDDCELCIIKYEGSAMVFRKELYNGIPNVTECYENVYT
jgi:hypothetical protein